MKENKNNIYKPALITILLIVLVLLGVYWRQLLGIIFAFTVGRGLGD